MICKICGQNIEKGIKSHLNIHSISNKEYYDIYIKTDNEGICPTCGMSTKFLGITKGYMKHCSNRCAQLNPETREKCRQTCLSKYGSTNVYSSEYGKNKIKETCLEKYGVEYALQSKIIQDKIRQTNIEKYGVINPQQNKDIKAKTISTNLIRYGNACAVHDSKIWSKAVQTMKSNGNYSKLEDYLEDFFIKNNIYYIPQYKDERYPFHCDFYLPNTDTFIEINGYWHHNNHFFDINNSEDLLIAQKWLELSKTKSQYKVALDVWTNRDVQKYNAAKQNNLHYIVLWNKSDITQFITNFTN